MFIICLCFYFLFPFSYFGEGRGLSDLWTTFFSLNHSDVDVVELCQVILEDFFLLSNIIF